VAHDLGHRERVLRAIGHQDLDRVPCSFIAEQDVQERLMREMNLSSRLDIIRFFDADTVELKVYLEPPDLARLETIDDVDGLAWPDRGSVDVGAYAALLRELRNTGLAVLAGAWASIFTGPRRTMGESKYLVAMLDHPDLIARITERMTESYLDLNEAIFSRCADCIDVFYFGSDFGSQRSLFIGRDSFVRFFKPHMTRLARHAKGFGLKVMFHTCGAVADIIPDLIDCGIDMLDPVQVSAHGMEPEALARDFKGRIAFHGGISTQTTLPHGTSAQVRDEVNRAIAALGPTGYVCGPDQNMMADTPTENVRAMYEAIHAFVIA